MIFTFEKVRAQPPRQSTPIVLYKANNLKWLMRKDAEMALRR